jgi:ferredoxin-NADP reductase
MGKNTWTARLARIYGTGGQSFARITSLPVVNIDGPYGYPPDFEHQHNIVLVAGGIGITPMISIVKDLHQLRKQNDPKAMRLKNLYLLWVVRDLAILEMFRDVFDEIHNDHTCKGVFHIMLRVTQRSFSAKIEGSTFNPPPVLGRPNLQQEFADIATVCGTSVLAMVCGPEPMVKEVQSAAYRCHFELHTETFEL